MLSNAAGIFVLCLGAVIVGGGGNAKLHPPQEFEQDAEGRLTLRRQQQPASHGAEAKPSLLIDTAAGLSPSVLMFGQAAHEVLVVVCDQPASLTDAYGLIKGAVA